METILQDKEHRSLTAQAANYRTIIRCVKAAGIDSFLHSQKRAFIDLELMPDDQTGGTSVNFFLKSIADECGAMDQKIISLSKALVEAHVEIAYLKEPKMGFLARLYAILSLKWKSHKLPTINNSFDK